MRTLIVLCAGSRRVDNIPLYLQWHPDGHRIAEKAILGIYPENYDRIVYAVLVDDCENYHAKDIIMKEIGLNYPVEVIALPVKTSGPAETVYNVLELGRIEGEISIRDTHNFIQIENDFNGNFIVGLDLTTYDQTIDELRSKSFVVLNEQSQILDVVEKRFCSDVISVGLYGFKNASDFKMAFERLVDPNYSIQKLYVSHIISYLIGYKGRVFHSVRASTFEDWATLSAWNRVQKDYSTCFLDMDEVCGVQYPFGSDVMQTLKKASERGCVFIGYSKHSGIDEKELVHSMNERGINVLAIVTGCTFSKIRRLIDSKAALNELILEG